MINLAATELALIELRDAARADDVARITVIINALSLSDARGLVGALAYSYYHDDEAAS